MAGESTAGARGFQSHDRLLCVGQLLALPGRRRQVQAHVVGHQRRRERGVRAAAGEVLRNFDARVETMND